MIMSGDGDYRHHSDPPRQASQAEFNGGSRRLPATGGDAQDSLDIDGKQKDAAFAFLLQKVNVSPHQSTGPSVPHTPLLTATEEP